MIQLDLFVDVRRSEPWSSDSAETREGWERAALRNLAVAPVVYCFPGFMGAVCERLVSKGLATNEALGDRPRPDDLPRKLWKWWTESGPRPQFRYTISDRGRRQLEAA